MPLNLLKGHWVLIKLKKSNLPSNSRKLVLKRVDYQVGKGKITMQELNDLKNKLNNKFIKTANINL